MLVFLVLWQLKVYQKYEILLFGTKTLKPRFQTENSDAKKPSSFFKNRLATKKYSGNPAAADENLVVEVA